MVRGNESVWRGSLLELRKYPIDFPRAGASFSSRPTFQRTYCGQEILFGQCRGAAKGGATTHFHQFPQPAYVVIMPVSCDYQADIFRGIRTEATQICQCSRLIVRIETGIDDYPLVVPDVYENAFSVAGTEEAHFDLVCLGWGRGGGQSRIDCITSVAHAAPCDRS